MQIVHLNYTDLFELVKSCHILTSNPLTLFNAFPGFPLNCTHRFGYFCWNGWGNKHAKCETIEYKEPKKKKTKMKQNKKKQKRKEEETRVQCTVRCTNMQAAHPTKRSQFSETFTELLFLFFLGIRCEFPNVQVEIAVSQLDVLFVQCLYFRVMLIVHRVRIFSSTMFTYQPTVCMLFATVAILQSTKETNRNDSEDPTNMLILQYFFSFFLHLPVLFGVAESGERVMGGQQI